MAGVSFNQVVLAGNMTRDVELRHTKGGEPVTDIGLAVNNRRKTQSGEWIDEVTFIDVTLWGRSAEVASQYLAKGSPILVSGRLKQETWESEGVKRSKHRIIAATLQMLGNGKKADEGGNKSETETLVAADVENDEVPF